MAEVGRTNFRCFVRPHMSCLWRTTGVESLPLVEQDYILHPDTLNLLCDGFE
jgi:hypothetical protein